MKKVLITGANSYIGMSFENYAQKNYGSIISIDTIDMIDGSWRNSNFSPYDVVFHVAGIAHADIGKVTEEQKKKYYEVNTCLAIETAKKAKADGVKQFILMSSAIIYGDSAPYGKQKLITAETEPNPSNFYGDSKWKAEEGVRALADDSFIVSVLRPPMIFGKGSKGNYPALSKLAKTLPIFPDVKNERSMLYIENLCEFLCQTILHSMGGVFFPQNSEYSNTSQLVKTIAEVTNHNIRISRFWNWFVVFGKMIPGRISILTNKAFGNMIYEQTMSIYDFDYQLFDLKESIRRSEG